MKRITLLLLCMCMILPCYSRSKIEAQKKQPTVFIFNTGDDAFRVDVKNNQRSYDKVLRLIRNSPTLGKGSIRVDGYCRSKKDLQLAKIRSNRLKACLISESKASERTFITRNQVGRYGKLNDVVVLTFIAPPAKKEITKQVETKPVPAPKPKPVEPVAVVEEPAAESTEDVLERPMPTPEPEPAVTPAPEPEPAPVVYEPQRWYLGVSGGIPFGVSTFTSFGEDKTRSGFTLGLLGGYRINPMLSAELGITFGNITLGASKCCADYWLGNDGVQYNSAVAGIESKKYSDIYSSVFIQQYSLRLNVDVMQIFTPDYNKKLSVMLSPAIYGVGSCATIKTVADKSTFYTASSKAHFGAGFDIAVGYSLTSNLGIRLSSGLNFITGKIDGIPGGNHSENLLWNNNLSLIWRLGE